MVGNVDASRRPTLTGAPRADADYEAAVAAFIRTKGITRCPTACVVQTQATIAPDDRAALHRRWAENESRRTQLGGRSGLILNQSAGGASPRNARDAGARGRDSLKANADRFAASVLPIVEGMQASGITGLSALADALNDRGIGAPRGGKWRGSAVRRLLARTR